MWGPLYVKLASVAKLGKCCHWMVKMLPLTLKQRGKMQHRESIAFDLLFANSNIFWHFLHHFFGVVVGHLWSSGRFSKSASAARWPNLIVLFWFEKNVQTKREARNATSCLASVSVCARIYSCKYARVTAPEDIWSTTKPGKYNK